MALIDLDGKQLAADTTLSLAGTKTEEETKNPAQSIVKLRNLVVSPGEFKLSIKITDSESGKNSLKLLDIHAPAYLIDNKISLSDIQIASFIRQVEYQTPFYKNGIEIIPNPSNEFGHIFPNLYFYYEIYNLVKTEPNTFTKTYQIINSFGETVKHTIGGIGEKNTEMSGQVGRIGISDLPEGAYKLKIIVRDEALEQMAQKEHDFAIKYAQKQERSFNITKNMIKRASDTELANYFRGIKYIARKDELKEIGWEDLDIILVSGDVYIDSPYDGSAMIGKVLIDKGYKVGIISQPDVNSAIDITRLGKPKLFWGVSAGCVDSMVANYTALKKKKRSDDLTPGGINNKRPDRAVIVYTNLIKQYFKDNSPIVIGGIEASLRRIAHYDYWNDKIRRSILFDAKADYLIYGMAEKTIIEFANALKQNQDVKNLRGLCYISKNKKEEYIDLPSYEDVVKDKYKFIDMFHTFYQNNDPLNAVGLQQLHDTRYLIQNPPNYYLNSEELGKIYNLDFEREVHPYYKKNGKVKALEIIQFSINFNFFILVFSKFLISLPQ